MIDAVHTPDGKSLLVASVTGRVQVRDAATGELRREFGHHPSAIRALALSPTAPPWPRPPRTTRPSGCGISARAH
ncbi:hypothetical protein NQP46_14880 [Streptomyces albus]|nr:hypothetical protein NQP46_14880 [Streptomyces albus]